MPGPSRQKRVVSTAGKFEAAEEDAHLLGVIHAVDHDHGRLASRARRLHEQCRQRGAFVGHLDELDVRLAQPDALVPDLIGVRALRLLLRPGHDEALGIVVIDAGAQVIVAGGDLVALGERVVAALLDLVAERAPFLEPGLAAIRLVPARAQPLAGAIHLLERNHAIGRHALQNQGRVRPEKIIAEMVDPGPAAH